MFKLNQAVNFQSANFKIKKVHSDGSVLLGSISKNLSDVLVNARNYKNIHNGFKVEKKRYEVPKDYLDV